jgi:[acyl-carrier-protein] S-malonyltransferase
VRWRECVGYMTGQGVGLFAELGAGKVLTGLAKKNAPTAVAVAIGAPDDITAALPHLRS